MSNLNIWRRGSKRHLIAEILLSGKSATQAYSELRPMVEAQSEPMVFRANVDGHRQPKPLHSQLIELRNEINRVAAALGRDEIVREDSSSRDDVSPLDEIPADETPEDEIEETEEEKHPVASGKRKREDAKSSFLAEVRRIREWCNLRELAGEKIDSISMRPIQAGARLIPAGIPYEALLSAMCLHWPDDAKRDAKIPEFDFSEFSRREMKSRGIEFGAYHELFGYALLLAENRQPIMTIGPAGTGKSHLAKQIAEYLELPYGETPMTPGATRGDLLGRHTITGFIPSQFVQLYAGGGVFNFEEIDASDPSMLIVLNNALAQSHLYNSVDGEVYEKSTNFVPWSTANTFGLGATREYTGREKLDAATIDRWRMGRIFMPLDEKVEESLLHAV